MVFHGFPCFVFMVFSKNWISKYSINEYGPLSLGAFLWPFLWFPFFGTFLLGPMGPGTTCVPSLPFLFLPAPPDPPGFYVGELPPPHTPPIGRPPASGVFGYLMGVLGYLMGTTIKYPRRRRPEADILGGGGWEGVAPPPQNMFDFKSPPGDLKPNRYRKTKKNHNTQLRLFVLPHH